MINSCISFSCRLKFVLANNSSFVTSIRRIRRCVASIRLSAESGDAFSNVSRFDDYRDWEQDWYMSNGASEVRLRRLQWRFYMKRDLYTQLRPGDTPPTTRISQLLDITLSSSSINVYPKLC